MPEITPVPKRKGFFRNVGPQKCSATLLGVDLQSDPIALLRDLLEGICTDCTSTSSDSSDTARSTFTRLNLLVHLSKRIWLQLDTRPNLCEPVLRAIFLVVRLSLWSSNPSVRCASLRCLRYFIRSASDVRLFLSFRLDLLVSRCLQLSYLPSETAPQTQPSCFRFASMLPSKDSNIRSSHTRMRATQSPSMDSNLTSPTNACPMRSFPLFTAAGECHQFMRLALHLIRVAPHHFPCSLLHALTGPCVRTGGRIPLVGNGNPTVRHFRIRPSVNEETVSDEVGARDFEMRACLMMLCELVVLLSEPHTTPDSHLLAVIDQLVMPGLLSSFVSAKNPLRLVHAFSMVLNSVINRKSIASPLPCQRLAKFFVPFTTHSTKSSHVSETPFDNYPTFVVTCKVVLVRMFRSWPGLFYFSKEGLPTLKTFMCSLAVGSTEIRNHILDLLFALFPTFPCLHPTICGLEPAIVALTRSLLTGCSVMLSQTKNTCLSSLFHEEYFVSREGCRVFPRFPVTCGPRVELVDCYTAFLLTVLIQAGLFEGLIRAVSDRDEHTGTRAGLLLGLIAYKTGALIPQEHPASHRLRTHLLIQTDSHVPPAVWIERVQRVMYSHDNRLQTIGTVHSPLHSPFLECLLHQSNLLVSANDEVPRQFQLSESWITQIILQSNVVSASPGKPATSFLSRVNPVSQSGTTSMSNTEPDQWDWSLLASLGRYLSQSPSMISWEDKTRMSFLQRIMAFLTPTLDLPSLRCPRDDSPIAQVHLRSPDRSAESTKSVASFVGQMDVRHVDAVGTNFAWMPASWSNACSAGILCASLIPHLAVYPATSEPGRLLNRFILAARDALVSLINHPASGGLRLFEQAQLSTSCSPFILLALGRLTATDQGESHLESTGLCPAIYRLLMRTGGEETELQTSLLSKIVLSSLDFKRPGRLGFNLLSAAVVGASESVRLYCVHLIRLLCRLQLPLSVSWSIDLVVKLCMDPSAPVAQAALVLLEELSMDKVNVEALTKHIIAHVPDSSNATISNSLTPFGASLLHHTGGGLAGHRIVSCVLSRSTSFANFVPAGFAEENDTTLLDDPVTWLLRSARQEYNITYASEVDKLLALHLEGPDDEEEQSRARRERFIQSLYANSADLYLGDPVPYMLTVPDPSLWIVLPGHVYGYLAEHPAGLELLINSGALQEAVDTVSSQLNTDQHRPTIEIKAALWCLAHVGSSKCGQTWLLQHPNILRYIFQLTVEADCMGLRGISWLCLNLIMSRCKEPDLDTSEIPEAQQWVLCSRPIHISTAVASTRSAEILDGNYNAQGFVDPLIIHTSGSLPQNALPSHSSDTKSRGSRYFSRYSSSISRRFFSRGKDLNRESSMGKSSNGPLRKTCQLTVGSSSGELECTSASKVADRDAAGMLDRVDHSSITWTHRDLISRRRMFIDLSFNNFDLSTYNSVPCCSTDNVSTPRDAVSWQTSIYLPSDMQTLGYQITIASKSTHSVGSPSSSSFTDPDSRSILSFVGVAQAVRCLLDSPADGGDAVSDRDATAIGAEPLDDTLKRSLDFNTPLLRLSEVRSHTCLSTLCNSSEHPIDFSASKHVSNDPIAQWASQLFDVVSSFPVQLNSPKPQQALLDLISEAVRHPGWLNACLYTEISDLMDAHTFPLEARSKIQSGFALVKLKELITDAQLALSQLDEHLSST